jgi:hypothetical protein
MANAVFNSYNSTYDGLYGTSLAGLPLLLSAGFGITEVTCPATTGYPGGLTYVDSSPTFQPVYGAPYIFQFQVNPIDFAGTGAAGDELAAVVELFDITANVTVNADGSYVSGYALPSLRFVANFTDTLNTANTYQYDLYMVNKSAANVAMDVQWVFNSQTFVGA